MAQFSVWWKKQLNCLAPRLQKHRADIVPYRFSAFWLRSKCSICSYQLNIWYGGHVPPSILNLFLSGDRVPGACSGSVTGWPGIAVPPGSAHFPTKLQRCVSVSWHRWPVFFFSLCYEIIGPGRVQSYLCLYLAVTWWLWFWSVYKIQTCLHQQNKAEPCL